MLDTEFERIMDDQKINAYSCGKEGHVLITRDVDQGTTPMTVTCRHCVAAGQYGVVAYSSWYNVDQDLIPTHEWFKAQYPERIPQPHVREHCQNGGLLLREVGQGDYTESLPTVPAGRNRPLSFSERALRTLTNANDTYQKQ